MSFSVHRFLLSRSLTQVMFEYEFSAERPRVLIGDIRQTKQLDRVCKYINAKVDISYGNFSVFPL